METTPINNAFFGMLAGVSAGGSAEKPQEGTPSGFFTMLKSILGGEGLQGEAAGAEGSTATHQICIPVSLRPDLAVLLQKALGVESRERGVGEESSPAEETLEGLLKGQTGEGTRPVSGEVDLARADASVLGALVNLVKVLTDALGKAGTTNPGIDQGDAGHHDQAVTMDLNGQNDQPLPGSLLGKDEKDNVIANVVVPLLALISDALSEAQQARVVQNTTEGGDESPVADRDGRSQPLVLSKAEERKQSETASAKEPVEVTLTTQITSAAYAAIVRMAAKKDEEEEALRGSPVGDKNLPKQVSLTIGAEPDDVSPPPQGEVPRSFNYQADDRMEVVLARNIVHSAVRENAGEKETGFLNHLQTSANQVDESGNGNRARVLTTQEEIVLSEMVAKHREGSAGPEVKEVKASPRENDLMPFSKNGDPDTTPVQEAPSHKVMKEAAFGSVMTDRIEKIVEQFSARGTSMDMILRLKIDDRDTLLVGLKNEGQKVIVDVKSSNEGMINVLQNQKDTISRNLEEKHVYTSIFIDPEADGGFERRESRQNGRRDEQDSISKANFGEYLEASA